MAPHLIPSCVRRVDDDTADPDTDDSPAQPESSTGGGWSDVTPDRKRIVTNPGVYASQSTKRAKRRFPTLSTLPTRSDRKAC